MYILNINGTNLYERICLRFSQPLLLHFAESYWALKSLLGALWLYAWKCIKSTLPNFWWILLQLFIYLFPCQSIFLKYLVDSRIICGLLLDIIFFGVLYSYQLSLWQTLNTLLSYCGLIEAQTKILSHQADWDSEICSLFKIFVPKWERGKI